VLRDPQFQRYWTARIVETAGSALGTLALPLTAVLTLGASAMDMAWLAAFSTLPVLLLALHIGVWVDRQPRQPILVAANLSRAALLAVVPVAAMAGWLRMEVLWCIAFAVGALTVAFDIAVTSFMPALVERSRLIDANSTLHAGAAAARVAGTGAGGWLVQVIGAPMAMSVDAASYLISAALLRSLRVVEDTSGATRSSTWASIAEGIAVTWQDRVVRAMIVSSTIGALGGSVQQAVYVLFVVQDVQLSPATLGALVACGSVASLAGAACAGRTARRLTSGGAMLAGQTAVGISSFLVLAAAPGLIGVALLLGAQILFNAGLQTFSVTQISVRQALTPRHLLGRVNATRRVAAFGIQPVGALLGGVLGTSFGLHAALLVAALINVVAVASVARSPLAHVREM
jgi:MFS family permease